MAYPDDNEYVDEQEPVNIVSPEEFNIDPSTTRFAPMEYGGMLAQGLSNWYGANVVPAAENVGRFFHQAMLPEGQQVNPIDDPEHEINQPAEESIPAMHAIDSGYADKKLMNPMQDLREALAKGDVEGIDKAYSKLGKYLEGPEMSFMERFADNYFRTGVQAERKRNASKIASDLLMREVMQPGSTIPPTAGEAINLGLIRPEELIPGQQQPLYGHLIPNEPIDRGEPESTAQLMEMPAQPGQSPAGLVPKPGVQLTPLQQGVVGSRMQAIGRSRTTGAGRGPNPTEFAMQGFANDLAALQTKLGRPATEEEKAPLYKYWTKQQSVYDKLAQQNRLVDARVKELGFRGELEKARADYTKQLPQLMKDLKAMTTPQQSETVAAIQRVRAALAKGEKPDMMDVALVSHFLRGTAPIAADALGRLYDRITGMRINPETGEPFPVESEEGSILGGYMSQFRDFINGLAESLKGAAGGAKLPSPKTPEEAAKLEPGTHYLTPDGKEMVR